MNALRKPDSNRDPKIRCSTDDAKKKDLILVECDMDMIRAASEELRQVLRGWAKVNSTCFHPPYPDLNENKQSIKHV